MEEHEQSQALHPEVEKILNFEIPARKIRKDLQPEEGAGVLLKELIEPVDIRFDQRTGKPMMLHGGILSICDGIGIEFLPPEIEKTGEREYQATVGIRLGDGSVFYATGEASAQNTDNRELSGKYPVNQTHIRALNKAVVRALGLYRVLLTEEEADEFKTPQMQKMQQEFEAAFNQYAQKAQNKEARLVKVISGMMDLVALPSTDEKYPNVYLRDIKDHIEDYAYLEALRGSENKILGFVANQLLKEHEKDEMAVGAVNEEVAEHVKELGEENQEPDENTEASDEQETLEQTEESLPNPIEDADQTAFLKELKEGQEILQKELESAETDSKE